MRGSGSKDMTGRGEVGGGESLEYGECGESGSGCVSY